MTDRPANLAYLLAEYLSRAGGARSTSPMMGGAYITRLARSYGLLDEHITAQLHESGQTVPIDADMLLHMGVIQRVGGGYILLDGHGHPWAPADDDQPPHDEPSPPHHQPPQPPSPQQQQRPRITVRYSGAAVSHDAGPSTSHGAGPSTAPEPPTPLSILQQQVRSMSHRIRWIEQAAYALIQHAGIEMPPPPPSPQAASGDDDVPPPPPPPTQ